jgi:UDPglucose 6-dehydrogenase
MRESPSISLITGLLDTGARVVAFDPVGMQQAQIVLPDITYCGTGYSCADGADAPS